MAAIAGKYARALVDAGAEKGALQGLRKDFRYFLDLLEADADLRFIFISPNFLKEDEVGLMDRVLSGKVQDIFIRFIEILIRRSREKLVYEIYNEFTALADRAEGIKRVRLTTAFPLEGPQKKAMEEMLGAKLSGRIVIENDIDAGVIGGGVLRVGDAVLDGSLAQGLRNLQEELSKC